MGYAGGTTINPTYRSIGDHTECFQVDYDPNQIDYKALLAVFWSAHEPTQPSFSRQYQALVLAHDADQLRYAEAAKGTIEHQRKRTVHTDVRMLETFYLAEDYHQKFYLQKTPALMRELSAYYPEVQDLREATSAARVNGYVGGYGTPERLAKDLPHLGLSDAAGELLKRAVSARSEVLGGLGGLAQAVGKLL